MPDYINPEREAFKAFAKIKSDTPIHMLNLVKLNGNPPIFNGVGL